MHTETAPLVNLAPGKAEIARLTRLADWFTSATPDLILSWAFAEFGDRLTIATGFGAEGMALLDMAAKLNAQPQVFFLDTGFLFPETYELRRRIEARYGIAIQAYQTPLTPEAQAQQYGDALWQRNADLCCRLRKLEPLKEALRDKQAWVTAIRRDQTAARANAKPVEWDGRWNLVKVNPLVAWSKKEVWRYIARHDVPYNPLHDAGYPSIGCTHCTRAVTVGEDDRSGRWANQAKTECGLHAAPSV